ncbi:hypothetical protein ALC56_10749 [Trachymyrmex septentrionalis]|uniref:Uncharacterized protein n=1 Tax=Trachymyrmex septentrionalis TaxID=34720 RepID=A0A195F320_9HYME|nr:hypothetical protein ALC56_10749 [Trachymyrmex septentrionalis]
MKKFVTVDVKVNWRNDRWLLSVISNESDIIYMSTLFICRDIVPSYFCKKGETITKEVYLRILKTIMKPCMKTTASRRPYIFQVIERVSNKSRHPNGNFSSRYIEATFMNLDKEQLKRVCSHFRERIE